MDNNSTLKKLEEIHEQAKLVAVHELLRVLFNIELCSMLNLTVVPYSPSEIVITGHKVGVLAHLTKKERDRWECLPEDSLMSSDEVSIYTNPKFVEDAIKNGKLGVFRESNDEEYPDGVIPAKAAVEICLRKTEFHDLVKEYLDNGLTSISIHASEIEAFSSGIDSSHKELLRVLPTAFGMIEKEGTEVQTRSDYADYLCKHPLGTDKIIKTLKYVIWVLEDENARLKVDLGDPEVDGSLAPISKKLIGMGKRFMEAPGKFQWRISKAGGYYTPILNAAYKYGTDACGHNSFIRE